MNHIDHSTSSSLSTASPTSRLRPPTATLYAIVLLFSALYIYERALSALHPPYFSWRATEMPTRSSRQRDTMRTTSWGRSPLMMRKKGKFKQNAVMSVRPSVNREKLQWLFGFVCLHTSSVCVCVCGPYTLTLCWNLNYIHTFIAKLSTVSNAYLYTNFYK